MKLNDKTVKALTEAVKAIPRPGHGCSLSEHRHISLIVRTPSYQGPHLAVMLDAKDFFDTFGRDKALNLGEPGCSTFYSVIIDDVEFEAVDNHVEDRHDP